MAGHSHWAGIKHRKAAQDKKRSKYFSKFSKAIMVAAREGGGEPEKNLKLRYAIDKAKAGNMPNDAIDRAIKKATGELGDRAFEEIVYEGYGPGGVGVIAEALTDNRNRTAPEVRKLFSKSGGNMGTPGSVSFQFERQGLIGIPTDQASEEEVFEAAVEAGADDVQPTDEELLVRTDPQAFEEVRKALAARDWRMTTVEIAWVPSATTTPEDAETARRVETLLSELEDHDDIQGVHSTYAPPDDAG